MKKSLMKRVSLLAAALIFTVPAFAHNPMVGGHAMSAHKNIVQNALNSGDHKTLVKAVKQVGLVKALEGKGSYKYSRQLMRQLTH